jgi:hypothetical protein
MRCEAEGCHARNRTLCTMRTWRGPPAKQVAIFSKHPILQSESPRASILTYMAIVAEVKRNNAEQTVSLIRRFSKRVQGSRALNIVRDRRYFARHASKLVKKNRALNSLSNRKERERLFKLGKLVEKEKRRR